MIYNLTVHVKVSGKNPAKCAAIGAKCDFSYTPEPWDGTFLKKFKKFYQKEPRGFFLFLRDLNFPEVLLTSMRFIESTVNPRSKD